MSKFEFRLQVPLRLARASRASLRRELAQIMRQSLESTRAVRAMQERLQESAAALVAEARLGISGADLTIWTERREAARQAMPELQKRCDELTSLENRVRERLGQASRETQTYERLNREAFDAWRRDRERLDQALVDDALMVRRAREAAYVREES